MCTVVVQLIFSVFQSFLKEVISLERSANFSVYSCFFFFFSEKHVHKITEDQTGHMQMEIWH